jgi:hypothetical protein
MVEVHILKVFESRVLRRIFGPQGVEIRKNGESCIVGSFIICTHPQISLAGELKENELVWACGTHGRGEEIVKFLRET